MKTISLFILSLLLSVTSYSQLKESNTFKLVSNVNQELSLKFNSAYLLAQDDKKPNFLFPTVYSLSIMTVNIAILVMSGHARNSPSFSVFSLAYTAPPVIDKDHWTTNYIAHPLMGSETYLRARENNFGPFGSFLFSTAASLTWEYLIESWTEPPSIQDLLVTSTSGSILGEFRYKVKQNMNPKHHWIIDPIHSAYLAICKKDNGKPQVLIGISGFFPI